MQPALAVLHVQALSQSQSFQNYLGVDTSGITLSEMHKKDTIQNVFDQLLWVFYKYSQTKYLS